MTRGSQDLIHSAIGICGRYIAVNVRLILLHGLMFCIKLGVTGLLCQFPVVCQRDISL